MPLNATTGFQTGKTFRSQNLDHQCLSGPITLICGFFHFRVFSKYFWLGGAAPQFLAAGAKPPKTPPLNGRLSHLIEAAKRGRLDQMIFFFGAADDTVAADDTSQHCYIAFGTLFSQYSL